MFLENEQVELQGSVKQELPGSEYGIGLANNEGFENSQRATAHASM